MQAARLPRAVLHACLLALAGSSWTVQAAEVSGGSGEAGEPLPLV